MKITFVLPTVNMSGGVRVVAIYAKLLAARGHTVTLVSPPLQLRKPLMRERLMRPFRAAQPPSAPRPKSHLDGLGLDHRVLDVWRPVVVSDLPDADVVIATWWETAEWVAHLSAAKGTKVYLIQHHEVFEWLAHERSRATYRLPLHKIVVAEWLRRVMAETYGDHEVDLVHNSIDHAQFHAAPRAKQRRPTVGFLYSPVKFKGVDVTLQALARLRQRLPDLRVVAFGSLQPPSPLPGVDFFFDPPQAGLRELYARCDVWLTASRTEGFNLPAMEAMACRTPVVSTRTGWPEEAIVEGSNGALVDVDDVEALADAAQRVLQLPEHDWQRMSRAAFETVEHSSWDRCADRFEAALQRAAARAADRVLAHGAVPGTWTAERRNAA